LKRKGKVVGRKNSIEELSGSKKVFGWEHLDTVQALCGLSSLVSEQNEFQPAQDLAERLSKREDVLGESTEMRQSVVNLAKALAKVKIATTAVVSKSQRAEFKL